MQSLIGCRIGFASCNQLLGYQDGAARSLMSRILLFERRLRRLMYI